LKLVKLDILWWFERPSLIFLRFDYLERWGVNADWLKKQIKIFYFIFGFAMGGCVGEICSDFKFDINSTRGIPSIFQILYFRL
jgi:hypothetical protein